MTIATDFASLGICGYAGYSFGPSMDVKGTMVPRYSECGRLITHYEIQFHFEWWIQSSSQSEVDATDKTTTTDADMELLRSQLMHEGMDFQFANAGVGMINVNPIAAGPPAPQSKQFPNEAVQLDPVWGPKPQKFTWDTYNAKAIHCQFDINVAFLNCPEVLAQGKIMEFCYTLQWTITDGYTKRVFKGFLRIPGNRQPGGGRALQANADDFLDGAIPAVPTGFERLPQTRTLSMDKCRLDFEITDAEVEGPNFPPAEVVKVVASHSVTSPGPAFQHWTGTFDGTYEYPPSISAGLGFTEFKRLIKARLDNLDLVVKSAGLPGGATIIATSFTMTEPEIYGRGKGKFQLRYTFILGGVNPNDKSKSINLTPAAARASGLWRLVSEDYDTWATTMEALGVWSHRGYQQLGFKNTDEVLINLCTQRTEPVPLSPGGGVPTLGGVPTDTPGPGLDMFGRPLPTPDASFLQYKLGFLVRPSHSTTEMKPLPTQPVQHNPSTIDVNDQTGYRPPYDSSNPSVIQYRNNPRLVLTMRGWAMRAGFTITPPEITSIAGLTPAPAPGDADFFETHVAGGFTVPFVFAAWSKSYILPDVPSPGQGFTPPGNPLSGGPANATAVFGG